MIRVRVVDDRDILRAGVRAVLGECADIDVVDAVDHDGALGADVSWEGLDVVIVDAADDRRADDQFPGVAVVERVRSSGADPRPNVIVVTGHAVHDGLRARMREAGADWFLHRTDMGDDLVTAVRTPPQRYGGVPAPADTVTLGRLGWNDRARVNDAVRWAVGGGHIGGIRSRSRRGLQRARAEFTRLTRLDPRNGDGNLPQRRQDTASAAQASRFLRWATKIETQGD